MDTKSIIKLMVEEISRLEQAKAALRRIDTSHTFAQVGAIALQKSSRKTNRQKVSVAQRPARAKRVMSAEGKARIAAAQKLRWAKSRVAAKKAAKKVVVAKSKKQATKAPEKPKPAAAKAVKGATPSS